MATRAHNTTIHDTIKTVLVKLSESDVDKLSSDGVMTADDLSFIQFEDLNAEVNELKRRKLDMTRLYLLEIPDNNMKITATTTLCLSKIKEYMNGMNTNICKV